MSSYLLALLFSVLVWWISTGVILYLDGLPRHTFKWTMLGTTGLLGLALWGLSISSMGTGVADAYCAFTCAILVWAWQEMAFLLGYVTGPRRSPCPPEAKGWSRAVLAFQAVVHHELALVALAAAVLAVTWDGPNQTGWWTYLVLWTMRQSAKLNVFFGVRNLNESFLPPHLSYLQSYFTRRRMNLLLPVSVIAATWVVIPMWGTALAPSASAFTAAQHALVASLLSLAILEHAFLVLPLPSERLWSWGMGSRTRSAALPVCVVQPAASRTPPSAV